MKTHPTKGKHAPGARWWRRDYKSAGCTIELMRCSVYGTRRAVVVAGGKRRTGYAFVRLPTWQGVPLLREENLEDSPVRPSPPSG